MPEDSSRTGRLDRRQGILFNEAARDLLGREDLHLGMWSAGRENRRAPNLSFEELIEGCQGNSLTDIASKTEDRRIIEEVNYLSNQLDIFPRDFETTLVSSLKLLRPKDPLEFARNSGNPVFSAVRENGFNMRVVALGEGRRATFKEYLLRKALRNTLRYSLPEDQVRRLAIENDKHPLSPFSEATDGSVLAGALNLPGMVGYMRHRQNDLNIIMLGITEYLRNKGSLDEPTMVLKDELEKVSKLNFNLSEQCELLLTGVRYALNLTTSEEDHMVNFSVDGSGSPGHMIIPGTTGFLGQSQIFLPSRLPKHLYEREYSIQYGLQTVLFDKNGNLQRKNGGFPFVFQATRILTPDGIPLKILGFSRART